MPCEQKLAEMFGGKPFIMEVELQQIGVSPHFISTAENVSLIIRSYHFQLTVLEEGKYPTPSDPVARLGYP